MSNLIFIKLGGSIITNKEVPMVVRTQVLQRLVDEIAAAAEKTGDRYVVGHGQGSFAHAPAMRYRTMEGFVSQDSKIGMAITQDSAAQLNRIVVNAFLTKDIPAVSYYMSNALVTENDSPAAYSAGVFLEYLNKGLFPISGGDVLVDSKRGCTIWSTEKVLAYLIGVAQEAGYDVSRIVHVTEVPGVFDADQNVIPVINSKNADEVHKMMGQTKGFDVTGGMWHKIDESLQLAEKGVESVILSGMVPRNVYSLLTGEKIGGKEVICTRILAE